MLTIDAQVHAYERNHPGRPWHGVLADPPEVTGDQMAAEMDAVGVDGAILVSAFTMYRYDAIYALEVHKFHPPPVCARQAGGSGQPGRRGRHRGLETHAGRRRCPHAAGAQRARHRRSRSGPQSRAGDGGAALPCRPTCTSPGGSTRASSSSAAIPIRRSSSIT
jgi:hypothetical protein